MKHPRLLASTFLLMVLSLPVQAANSGEIITAAQVAAAIRHAGLNVSAQQVALPSDVVAKAAAPGLKVVSVGAWRGDFVSVRLECVASQECLPFVVTVRRSPTSSAERLLLAANVQTSLPAAVDAPGSKFVIRVGSQAVLLLDGDHVHIQLAVICLENGAVGQTIRVAAKARQQTYLAEVCGDGLLRGRL